MSEKSSAEVIIGGKVYTLSGYEGEEYLQKVAARRQYPAQSSIR